MQRYFIHFPTMELINKIRKTIVKHKMITTGETVTAAVSGGPDSVCLLDVLDRLRDEMGFTLEVAHFEHGIRGESSVADADFVREIASVKNLKFHFGSKNPKALMNDKKLSIEEAARDARYVFFENVRNSSPLVKIATGHTSNDQAETVLMRLLRGSGPRGLAGIPPVRGCYIRPLIEIERSEIMEYLNECHLKWRVDETNELDNALRNRIRHDLIPALKRDYNPRVVEALCRGAEASRETVDYIDATVEKIAAEEIETRESGIFIPLRAITENHPALATGIFEAAFKMAAGNLRKLRFEHRAAPIRAAREGRVGIYNLPGGLLAAVDRSGILITQEMPEINFEYCVPLKIPGKTSIDVIGAEIEAEIIERCDTELWKNALPDEAYLDFDLMTPPFEARSWKTGDRMIPLGTIGTKKIQDIFTDSKTPCGKKPFHPIIATAGEIAWAARMRISDKYKISEKTKIILRLKFVMTDTDD